MVNRQALQFKSAKEYADARAKKLGWADKELRRMWESEWESIHNFPFGGSTPQDAYKMVTNRFFRLAVARTLQAYRGTDIDIMREFIDGKPICDLKFSAMPYKNAGAVTGRVIGMDRRGYEYQRWTITDADAAKKVLNQYSIKPFKQCAIGYLLSERHVSL